MSTTRKKNSTRPQTNVTPIRPQAEEEQPPITHSLLEVWQNILSNVEESLTKRLTPGAAAKAVSTWPKMNFPDVPVYLGLYHQFLLEYREILEDLITEHPEALEHLGPDDGESNHDIYLQLLIEWQKLQLAQEFVWDATEPDAAARLAAIADSNAFMLGQMGLVAHLDQIGFDYTPDEREKVSALLKEFSEELEK